MIIALHNDIFPEGQFVGNTVVVGGSKDECISALQNTHAFAEDIGESIREEDGVVLYTMIGGSFI